MGGRDSGRKPSSKKCTTTDDYRKLDIRYLRRCGLLKPGRVSTVRWSTGGKLTGGVTIRAFVGCIELDYKVRSLGTDWKMKRVSVNLVRSDCHLGGSRQWFECPTSSCRRRVAILYGGEIFVCRTCRNLTYPSQYLPPWERSILKADRIRDRLGWKPGIFNGLGWQKPKGMHWRTFERLVADYRAYERIGLRGLSDLINFRG